MTTTKWIAATLIMAGVVLVIFGLMSFRPSVAGFSGYDYGADGKIEAATGGALLAAGVMVLRFTRAGHS